MGGGGGACVRVCVCVCFGWPLLRGAVSSVFSSVAIK